MFGYFKWSFVSVLVGLVLAFWRGHEIGASGMMFAFTALSISILEIAISFDNAVVNAVKLRRMSDEWRHRFLTWGILIAVFGMRFIFPILIVSIFAQIPSFKVLDLAIHNPTEYVEHLHHANPGIVSFGGMFLLMLFLKFFIDPKKDVHWIVPVEKFIQKLARIKFIVEILGLSVLGALLLALPHDYRLFCGVSGFVGIILFLGIDGIAHCLERHNKDVGEGVRLSGKAGFAAFMYLELIDASFSLDGVLGAFAFSNDVVVIAVGLGVGAMFVRSLTIMLVERKALEKLLYLTSGAYWAIGALSFIMLFSALREVPEAIAATVSAMFIVLSLISSLRLNKRLEKAGIEHCERVD
jgi:Uncharacterized protein conserved in bacteria